MSQDMAMQITHLLYQKIDVLKNTRNKAQNKLDAAFWQQYEILMMLTFYMFLRIVSVNSKFQCTPMTINLLKSHLNMHLLLGV